MKLSMLWAGGSGAKIASYIGFLEILEVRNHKADLYAGLSGGAIAATFAALEKVGAISRRLIALSPSDVYYPPIFTRKGRVRPAMCLLGLAMHGGECLTSFKPLKRELLQAVSEKEWQQFQKSKTSLGVYTLDFVQNRLCWHDARDYPWPGWVQVLLESASVPGISPVEERSDAGLQMHLPLQLFSAFQGQICALVTVNNKLVQRSGFLGKHLSQVERMLVDNYGDEKKLALALQSETRKIQIVELRSRNSAFEFDVEAMNNSYIQGKRAAVRYLQQQRGKATA